MSIAQALQRIQNLLPSGVGLVAVSKFHPKEAILEAYQAGQRMFGESRVQELYEKQFHCPGDIEWHFIGHLQTNKVRQIVPFVGLIHGVDSLRLLKEIQKEGEKINRIVPCLLQIHIAQEATKFGFSIDECRGLLNDGTTLRDLTHVRLEGLMGMATLTDNTAQIQAEFHSLKTFFDELKNGSQKDNTAFTRLSMGMSDDYRIAVEEGSTLVRIGSAIFGTRA